jgi:hypothetical protein
VRSVAERPFLQPMTTAHSAKLPMPKLGHRRNRLGSQRETTHAA